MDTIATCIITALGVLIPVLVVYAKSYFEKLTERQRLETEQIRLQLEELKNSSLQRMDQVLEQTKPGAHTHGIDDLDMELKAAVLEALEKLRSKAGATRVTMWSFHNGSYYSTGNPQRKIQTTFEALTPERKVPSEADVMKNESVNGFLCVLQPLSNGTFQSAGGYEVAPGVHVLGPCEKCARAVTCDNAPHMRPRTCLLRCRIDDMQFTTRFYRVMSNLGTKVWYGIFIVDERDNKFGVLTVQYDTECEEAELFPEIIDVACDTCNRIAASVGAMRACD